MKPVFFTMLAILTLAAIIGGCATITKNTKRYN